MSIGAARLPVFWAVGWTWGRLGLVLRPPHPRGDQPDRGIFVTSRAAKRTAPGAVDVRFERFANQLELPLFYVAIAVCLIDAGPPTRCWSCCPWLFRDQPRPARAGPHTTNNVFRASFYAYWVGLLVWL